MSVNPLIAAAKLSGTIILLYAFQLTTSYTTTA